METINFFINHGVKQGSVLSLVHVPLSNGPDSYNSQEQVMCPFNVCSLYLGAFCHADDIRSSAL